MLNVPAEEAIELLKQLYNVEGMTLAADPRTGAVIARGPAEPLEEIEVLLQRLDEPTRNLRTKENLPTGRANETSPERARSELADAQEQISSLKESLLALQENSSQRGRRTS